MAAKGIQPRLSLGILFLSVQFLDVLFAIFVLAGVEKMRIVTGFTAYHPYDLYFMPFTHSLPGAAIWSIVLAFGLCLFSVSNNPTRRIFSLFVALAVFSHFLLDLPMHTADLTLGFSGQDIKFGFGLWNYMWLSLLAELIVFGFGIVLYWNSNELLHPILTSPGGLLRYGMEFRVSQEKSSSPPHLRPVPDP